MTLRELEQLVSLGEGISLEFKRRVPRPERIAKEIVALANTNGGRIVLGVSDDGTIEGFENISEQVFLLREATKAHCSPPVDYDTERVVVADRRDVIVVTVPESPSKPHVLVPAGAADGAGPTYVRVEDRSVEASDETIEHLETQQTDDGVTFEFGETESLLMRYLDDYGRITVPQLAQLADISPERASQTLLRLTRADLLHLHSAEEGDYFTLNY
ncbi:MAG: helix-turn-helix domain-containing protein [Salinibacter sp.]